MEKVKNRFKSFLTLALPLSLVYAAGCAEVRLHTIPAPPPTAKLRVYIQVLTSTENVYWMLPHQVFEKNTIRFTAKTFQEKGIYEVVSQDDIKAALGGRQVRMKTDWSRKNWALARQVGRAVHAEYALFVDRRKLVENQYAGTVFYEMILVNTETGKKFRVLAQAPARFYIGVEEYQKIFKIFHRELFRTAKEDMLATAIRKGRLERAATSIEMISRPALPPVSAVPTETRPSTPIPPVKSSPVERPAVVAKPETPKSPPPPAPLVQPPPAETRPSIPIPPVKSSPVERPAVVARPETPKSSPPPAPLVQPPPPEKPTAIAKAEIPITQPSPVPPLSTSAEPRVPKPSPPGISLSASPDPSSSFTAESRVDLEKALQAETQVEGRRRLAVYDLEAVEQYKIVALILSEALREELLRLDHFQLVNRENIVKVLEEMALQQTGLVDEKEAVKAGKGLAVQQIVLGRYGTLGKVSILQAKRLDVETQGALGIGSLKCGFGQEDELLQNMAVLARQIAGKNKE